MPQKLIDIEETFNEQLNEGLTLTKDQGFHVLSPAQKLYTVAYLFDIKNKVKSYVSTMTTEEYDSLDSSKVFQYSMIANAEWKKIEKLMGGPLNIISMMGVDIVEIIRKTRQLMRSKKMVLDKDGIEHKFDDGGTQFKALEFLAKISGNYSEEITDASRTSININFGMNTPAKPADIMSDNMEVVYSTHKIHKENEVVEEDD